MATRAGRQLLTREDWVDAALGALASGGAKAVSVDRLAKSLGATRGSFYWHFASRGELVAAALERWEREHTTALIPAIDAIADPVARLRRLFREVYEQPVDRVEIALASAADDPLVAPVMARVTRTRVAFLRRIFAELGLAPGEVADRAWLAYAFYVGHHQLGRNPGTEPVRPGALDRVVDLLCSPSP